MASAVGEGRGVFVGAGVGVWLGGCGGVTLGGAAVQAGSEGLAWSRAADVAATGLQACEQQGEQDQKNGQGFGTGMAHKA